MNILNKNKDGKENNKTKKRMKKHVLVAGLIFAIKIFLMFLMIFAVVAVIEWLVKIFQPKNTVDKIYKELKVEDVTELVQIKKNEKDEYYLDFVDDIDDKLQKTIDYLNSNAGVKSGIDKEFLKKAIKTEVATQMPDLGAEVSEGEGFQGITSVLRVTPDKDVGSFENTGAGKESTKKEDDSDKDNMVNKDEIKKQEEIVKSWKKGKELTLSAKAFVYNQENSKLNPGKKIDYWTPQKNKYTLQNLSLAKDTKVKYTGEYSISLDKMNNEGIIYVGIQKDDIKGYIKYNFTSNDSGEEGSREDDKITDNGYADEPEQKVTDTIKSKVYKLKYIPKETFDEYVSNGKKEALYCFTIDDDKNLITATWSVGDDGKIEIQNNSSINLKTALQNYILPSTYLLYYYIEADYQDFSDALADVALKSKVIMALEDNIDTSKTTQTVENKKVSENDDFSYDWTEGDSTEKISESCSTKIEIIYADTWCAKLENKSLYKSDLLDVTIEKSKTIKMPGTVTETDGQEVISKEKESGSGTDSKDETKETTENGKTEKEETTEIYEYKMYQRTITTTDSISNSYAEDDKVKTEVKEKIFVDLYKEHKMYNRLNDMRFLQILKNDEKTANLVDLTKYLMYMATGVDYGVKEYEFSEYEENSFINSGTPSSGGGLSLTTPNLSKDKFVEAMKAYSKKLSGATKTNFDNNFLKYAGNIYDWSKKYGVNPELVVVTAQTEQSFKAGGGSYNYWGIAVYNGQSSGSSFSSLEDGIKGYASVIKSYQTGWKADLIKKYAKERKAAGCDPTGYGQPDTLSGMQSIYSSLGEHVEGSSGAGGYYYMDPARAGITKIYKTHAEFLAKCKNSGKAEHAYGTTTTVWEQGQYTAYQVEQKLSVWKAIFGNYGTLSSGGSSDIVELAKTKLKSKYVLGTKGPDTFDCSGFVYWVYKQFGINVPGSTDAYKSYAGTKKEISWSEAQPGDILIVFNYERGTEFGHAGIYLGDDQYIHASNPKPYPQGGVKISSGAKKTFKHVFRFK